MHAVEGVSLTLEEGEVLGIVGESGLGQERDHDGADGPDRLARAACARKKLRFAGNDLLGISDKERRRLVGKDMAMIFQEPTTSLNPCFTIGWQLVEALRLHSPLDKASAQAPRHRTAGAGRHPGRAHAPERLPAPDVGRHEPAGDDRDGDLLQPAPADRRRADHGARRHHPGPDPGPAAQPAEGARHGAGADHPQHGRGERDGAARRGDVRRPGDGAAAASPQLFADPQHPYTEALLAALPERGAGGASARDHPRRGARRVRPARAAACSRRAAPTPPRIRMAVRPELRDWKGGQVRCHYPLGDPQRRAQPSQRDGAGAPIGGGAHDGRCRSEEPAPGLHDPPRPVPRARRSCRRWAASPSPSKPARRWRWSANPAAASRRWRAWCR